MRHVILTQLLMRRRQTGSPAEGRSRPEAPAIGARAGAGASVARWATPLQRHVCSTPLGPMLLAASEAGLAGLWFEGQRHDPTAAWQGLSGLPAQPASPLLRAAEAQLQAYFEGRCAGFDLPLDLSHGTPFQRQVWEALRQIPAGRTCTYAELAVRLGMPRAARAVGAAVGRNPLSILVPCHRVVGAQGALTGYAGGIERKRALLRLEGALA